MQKLRMACLAVTVLAGACAGIDRESAKSLGLAGQTATHALDTQVEASQKTLDVLNEWWAVHDALVCSNITAPALRGVCLDNVAGASASIHPPSLQQDRLRLSDVMAKRGQAIRELNEAYGAFVKLADYNSGEETATAIKSAFAGINSLSAAASALTPGGAALPAISSTFVAATSAIAAFWSDEAQARLMLSASRDIHTGIDALMAALVVERDHVASVSLLAQLQAEKAALYESGLDAGLIDPSELVNAVFREAYPGLQLSNPPAANEDVVKAAARAAIGAQLANEQAIIVQSYDAALATLQAVSKEHASLETKRPLDIALIQGEAKHMETILASLNKQP